MGNENVGVDKPEKGEESELSDKLDAAMKKLDALQDALLGKGRKDYEGNKRGEDPDDTEDGERDADGIEEGYEKLGKNGRTGEEAKPFVADSLKRADSASSFSDRARFGEAQATADRIYSAFSQSAFPPMSGEGLLDYRRRLLRPLQQHSKEFAKVDLGRLDAATFKGVESRVYQDAMDVAANPAALCGPGRMREVKKTDIGGRTITEYYGDPRSWMDDFAPPVERRLARINTSKQARGED